MRDDDDAWLDALAGRIEVAQLDQEGASADNDAESAAAVFEALALRAFIRQLETGTGPTVPTVDSARESELIRKALREGLLPPQGASAGSRVLRRPRPGRIAIPAAAVILIAVGIGLWQSPAPLREQLRGGDHGTVQLEATDPQLLRRQLTEELRSAGATVSAFERFGRLGLDVDLPQPLPKQIGEILNRHHIPIPADGVLVVEIKEPTH